MQRRKFLHNLGAWTALSASRVAFANQRIRVGLIGCGSRGTFDARLMHGPQVEISTLCDVSEARMYQARRWAPQAKVESEFRRVLADNTLDAVVISTPPQWHAQMLTLACQAGKDVYLETPALWNAGDANSVVNAVRRSHRIVQVGNQFRSASHVTEAARLVQSGQLGDVRFVRLWNGNFDMVHQIMATDIPRTVSSSGRQATYEYANFILSCEPGEQQDGLGGMAFYGTEAALFVEDAGLRIYPGCGDAVHNQGEPTPLHIRNFLDCVRTRKEPVAPIETGVGASTASSIGRVACRAGRKLSWDGENHRFRDFAVA